MAQARNSKYDFDLFTIGAGSGGVAGSRRAAAYGAKVGICENSRVGGTCVIRGCVPKKLLVYGAQVADEIADARGYGWDIGQATFSWPTLIANKNREIDRLNGIYIKMLADAGVELITGEGRMVDAHTVDIGGRRVTAERILIATGGHPVMPDTPGIEHAITSNEALELAELPKRVVVVGAGYIAVEFAGIFLTLGAEVTLVLRGDIPLRGFDMDVRQHLAQELTERGMRILNGTLVESIAKAAGGLHVTLNDGQVISCDQILYATGRVPNTRNLGLQEVGVKTDDVGAVLVDEWSRTSVENIYAVGDVTDKHNLTPVAIAEARALAETLYNDNPTKFDPHLISTAVFSQPPVATVGLAEHQAREGGKPVDIYRSIFRPMHNTLSGRKEKTLMKLVVDRESDRVLGCHMVGPDAAEIMQGLAIAMQCGATKKQFDRTVGIHPTAAEEFVTMRDKVADPAS
ncbi:glutathione-disulfide reductase [Eoetvoesiella caeni]|uniref:Glutathione reductase n=1 Tax=Eoetvoesiella caeni TaxID=645616 RepID=A0A366H1Z4_9BURK|nr:glutathione-disulfide reductase [Eoetvoesiella caeni]MCI2810828.1 glutathione-disulfide reductase [Eoetvoesiella caeni]NYT56725.1 glutathione-disulfide reductase [Eoetvoesiella caeni]RBP35766.1 NADPH-glutathione reductase [Eoetvoesiella caeni]